MFPGTYVSNFTCFAGTWNHKYHEHGYRFLVPGTHVIPVLIMKLMNDAWLPLHISFNASEKYEITLNYSAGI